MSGATSTIWADVQSAVQDAITDGCEEVRAHYLAYSFRVDGLHVCRASEYAALVAERDALRKALAELTDTAESDMLINQMEETPGWWSPRTSKAIAAARAALSHQQREEG